MIKELIQQPDHISEVECEIRQMFFVDRTEGRPSVDGHVDRRSRPVETEAKRKPERRNRKNSGRPIKNVINCLEKKSNCTG